MKRIAVVGVGLLGSAVASRLLAGGFTVTGYDTRPDQMAGLASRGLKTASSLSDAAAGAEAVFTILPSLDSVEAALLGAGGPLGIVPRTATLIQMSTGSPTPTPRPAPAADAARVRVLD